MMMFHVILFLISSISVNTRFSFYYSHISPTSYPTFDCLYAYLVDIGKEIGSPYVRNYHLIPYCQRPHSNEIEQQHLDWPFDDNITNIITFDELKNYGVTSQQLLQWYAPIDVAEQYDMSTNDTLDVFYNCSWPWFGSLCQYRFPFDSSLSFTDIVQATFADYSSAYDNMISGTCYIFIEGCNDRLWPLCLDWREVCDGKEDCMDGKDEEWCDELELSRCNADEYRCHYGGQCIPLSFVKDSRLSIDCLDGSDEQDHFTNEDLLMNKHCSNVQTFRCQERIGRYLRSFQCGDGQYLPTFDLPSRISYCSNKRDVEYSRSVLTSMEYITDINCREAFMCALYANRTTKKDEALVEDISTYISIVDKIWNQDCEPLYQYCAAEWLVIPEHPLINGYFQFVYFTNRSVSHFKNSAIPDLLCFYPQKCPTLLASIRTIDLVKGLTCSYISQLIDDWKDLSFDELLAKVAYLSRKCQRLGIEKSCDNSSYFYCNQSLKCIPYHRVGDGIGDCYFDEDELFDACQLNDSNRFICSSDRDKCLSTVAIGDTISQCSLKEDELYVYTQDLVKLIPFPLLCDLRPIYEPQSLNITETDETNCEWWPCNNPYTRCDKLWHCPNGADELDCPDSICSTNEHQCYNDLTEELYCLPVAYLYDKYLDDCNDLFVYRQLYFYNGTKNIRKQYLSWNDSKCLVVDNICHTHHISQISALQNEFCSIATSKSKSSIMSYVHLYENREPLCRLEQPTATIITMTPRYLTSTRLSNFPLPILNSSFPPIPQQAHTKKVIPNINQSLRSYCHRGIAILTAPNDTITCLCPPNYFGNQCQYQNQRISLTLQFHSRMTLSSTTIFQVIIILIDHNNGDITSIHEQIIYIPSRDCDTKYNIYLLYPHRPKHLYHHNYSIRIDLFDKINLQYWSSWYLPIPFPFLPVNRIATQLFIPEIPQSSPSSSCSLSCGEHGHCMHYINSQSSYFCQCDQGYSGVQCKNQHECLCSNDSYCLSSSICVCPLDRYGHYCYLKHSVCQSSTNPCQHGGLCIPNDDRIDLLSKTDGYTCFCKENYSGRRCENTNNQIDIYLDPDDKMIKRASLILIHIITTFEDQEHQRITMLKKIPYHSHNTTIYISYSFNILLIEIPDHHYYLGIIRETYIPSEHIRTQIQEDQRCVSINEINRTLSTLEYFRRTKIYPLLCRQNITLKCFYDQDLMCLCDLDRYSNCFHFNHTMSYDCQGFNQCLNNGKCLLNNQTCPTKSICICQDCYYGTKCQFSTKGFLLSLDPILAYHIKPYIHLSKQPSIVRISIFISILMLLLGLFSGILSIVIFHRRKSREVGTGNYLLISSITSISMIVMLTYKFWFVVLSQMLFIENRSLLLFHCKSIDYLLKIFLTSTEWLNACVALERMISVNKGTNFNKYKSKLYSKYVIVCVFLFTIVTQLHDPIYRELIDDNDQDEHRIWCFARFPISVMSYNTFINLFHFLVPFCIHVMTALRIIKQIAMRRSVVQPEQTYQVHLQREYHRHRHLLVAPSILILLSLPRMLLSYMKGCMRSAREPWLYLMGYFISFIPSILTFFVFVLPSQFYKKQLKTIYQRLRRRFCIKL